MLKKILTICIVLNLLIFSKLYADSYLYDEEETRITNNQVCSNTTYYIVDEDNKGYQQISIKDLDNYLLEEYQTNRSETEIVIPNGESSIKAEIYNTEDASSPKQTIDLTVVDCLEPEIKNPYEVTRMQSEVEISDKKVSFVLNTTLKNYKLTYKTKSEPKGIQVNEGTEIAVDEYPMTIQLTEEYTENDEDVTNYYEINILEDNYVIRNIKDLNIKLHTPDPISNFYYILLIIFIIGFIYFRKKETKYKKRLRRVIMQRRMRNSSKNKKEANKKSKNLSSKKGKNEKLK